MVRKDVCSASAAGRMCVRMYTYMCGRARAAGPYEARLGPPAVLQPVVQPEVHRLGHVESDVEPAVVPAGAVPAAPVVTNARTRQGARTRPPKSQSQRRQRQLSKLEASDTCRRNSTEMVLVGTRSFAVSRAAPVSGIPHGIADVRGGPCDHEGVGRLHNARELEPAPARPGSSSASPARTPCATTGEVL